MEHFEGRFDTVNSFVKLNEQDKDDYPEEDLWDAFEELKYMWIVELEEEYAREQERDKRRRQLQTTRKLRAFRCTLPLAPKLPQPPCDVSLWLAGCRVLHCC